MGEQATWYDLMRAILALALVVGLIYALAWGFKKYFSFEKLAGRLASHLKITQVMTLDPKKKLMIVEVENKRMLLGVTEQSVSLITELGAPLESSVRESEAQHAIHQ